MIKDSQIKPNSAVVCSKNVQFATVDHMEGSETIKLKKDKDGQHHYIPLSWVTKVDDKVHVDRPGEKAVKEWLTSPPTKSEQSRPAKSDKSPQEHAAN